MLIGFKKRIDTKMEPPFIRTKITGKKLNSIVSRHNSWLHVGICLLVMYVDIHPTVSYFEVFI